MRVAVVTTSYPSSDGDPAGHFVETEVSDLRRAGHLVNVVRPRSGGAFGWPGVGIRLRAKPWLLPDVPAWMAAATTQLITLRPDRIVAHWCVPSAWPVALAPLAARPDTELEVVSHGGDVRLLLAMPEAARARVVRSIARRAMRWRFVSEELLATLSTSLGPHLAQTVRAVADVVPSPIAMLDVQEESRAHRRAVGDRRLYVCAGRLVPSKRVDRVIDYVAAERGTQPVLIVLGDGPERENLERLARAWPVDARFLGKRPRREALSWIGAADEVLHASRAEGLSTVVREARQLGVLVTLLP